MPILIIGDERLPLPLWALFCALLWLSLEIWLSRALHWDGLADLGDALGSAAEGEKFVKILLDSRLGAFGAILLILLLLWQLLFLAGLFYKALSLPEERPFFALPPLACAWGRISPLWLAAQGKARSDSFLGKTFCKALTPRCLRFACLQALLSLFLAALCGMLMPAIIALIFCQIFLLRYLAGIAIKNGGLSGDFFGSCVVLSQSLFLGCACLGTS